MEGDETGLHYPAEVKYIVNALDVSHFHRLADKINADHETKLLLVQHDLDCMVGIAEKFLIDLLEKSVEASDYDFPHCAASAELGAIAGCSANCANEREGHSHDAKCQVNPYFKI